MKTIKDDKDRSIHIFDNAISQADHEIFYTFVMKSLFQIGFEDIILTFVIHNTRFRTFRFLYGFTKIRSMAFN